MLVTTGGGGESRIGDQMAGWRAFVWSDGFMGACHIKNKQTSKPERLMHGPMVNLSQGQACMEPFDPEPQRPGPGLGDLLEEPWEPLQGLGQGSDLI